MEERLEEKSARTKFDDLMKILCYFTQEVLWPEVELYGMGGSYSGDVYNVILSSCPLSSHDPHTYKSVPPTDS
ncbi:unnamed protein product [Diplocarpon coronariae]